MTKAFITVAAPAQEEFIEKKSRFIGYIAPATCEEEAQAFLDAIRKEHRSARHNCYAWICGDHDQWQRSSDDGEPSGTAGRPILEHIKHAQLHNTVIVVTRYFGGVLLGTGGLTRAYGKAAQLAAEAAVKVRKIPAHRWAVYFDYSLLGKVEQFFLSQDCIVEHRLFTDQVCFMCAIEIDKIQHIREDLDELTAAAVRWHDLGEDVTIDVPV